MLSPARNAVAKKLAASGTLSFAAVVLPLMSVRAHLNQPKVLPPVAAAARAALHLVAHATDMLKWPHLTNL